MHRRKNWKQSLCVCRESFRKWITEPRIWAVLFLIILFEWVQIEKVRDYCSAEGLAVSNWLFVFLFTSNAMGLVFFYLGVILLFCDAPFVDNQQLYVIIRTGSRNWFRGKILYVIMTSAVYFMCMYIVSILECIPYVGFSMQWEMVLESLSRNGTVGIYQVVFPEAIIHSYRPVTACALCYLLNVMVGSFLGLLIFYINLFGRHNLGTGTALAIVMLHLAGNYITVAAGWILQYFSPVSWVCLDIFTRDYGGVPMGYAFAFLLTGIVLLIILIMKKQKSYNLEAMEEL